MTYDQGMWLYRVGWCLLVDILEVAVLDDLRVSIAGLKVLRAHRRQSIVKSRCDDIRVKSSRREWATQTRYGEVRSLSMRSGDAQVKQQAKSAMHDSGPKSGLKINALQLANSSLVTR